MAFGNLKPLALHCFDSFFFQILHSYGSPAFIPSCHKGSFTVDCVSLFTTLFVKTVKVVFPPMSNLFPSKIKTPQPFSAFSLRGQRSSHEGEKIDLLSADFRTETHSRERQLPLGTFYLCFACKVPFEMLLQLLGPCKPHNHKLLKLERALKSTWLIQSPLLTREGCDGDNEICLRSQKTGALSLTSCMTLEEQIHPSETVCTENR